MLFQISVRPSIIFGTQIKIFMIKSESFLTIDSKAIETFKAQKGSKNIVKIVHVTIIKNILICVRRWKIVLRVWTDMRVSN